MLIKPSLPHMQVLTTYANSIMRGHRHIYKSLPRLLTLWYDFGTQAAAKSDSKVSTSELRSIVIACCQSICTRHQS